MDWINIVVHLWNTIFSTGNQEKKVGDSWAIAVQCFLK